MRVTVMGLGRFGGGLGAARYFLDRGHDVTVTDLAPATEFAKELNLLRDLGRFREVFGEHCASDFRLVDLVVASPAVPWDHVLLTKARKSGIQVTTELERFLELCPAKVLAVTGSNGKTTTCHLALQLLRTAGLSVRTVGNMGKSLLPEVETLSPKDWVVAEISSFQLEVMRSNAHRRAKNLIEAALITPITPNHLDRHETFENYRTIKASLMSELAPQGRVIFDGGGSSGEFLNQSAAALGLSHSDVGMAAARPWHLGLGNKIHAYNLGQALALAQCADASIGPEQGQLVADAFRGLPHRLEDLGEFSGLRFVNDSKSTTPEATAAALSAFRGPVALIAGGYDKGLDPGPLLKAAVLAQRVDLIGQTGPKLARALESLGVPLGLHDSLQGAFAGALAAASRPGVLLLSPGHASYGMWRDYRARGDEFRRLLQALL
ncbi:MAG: UDP-N-acetylmuramoyl-L-alanine--D-glutamate ligase [Planctomycetota bacterium]